MNMLKLEKLLALTFVTAFLSTFAIAEEGKLIFSDDFERTESQELKDEVGKGWKTNSATRAKGNKQVDLKDGAMHITIHAEADHAVSVTHPVEFTDGSVELKFMLKNSKDNLGLNFADLKLEEVHAGHLCVARISTKDVQISDLKTGAMNRKTRELRLAKQLTPAMQAMLKTKSKRFPHKLEIGKWHSLRVVIKGETLQVDINGETLGSFSSSGIAHPTKRMLRLSVPNMAVVDDVRIYSLDEK